MTSTTMIDMQMMNGNWTVQCIAHPATCANIETMREEGRDIKLKQHLNGEVTVAVEDVAMGVIRSARMRNMLTALAYVEILSSTQAAHIHQQRQAQM